MCTLALIGLSTTLAVLSSCGFAAGSLTGNALFGDESYDIGYDMDADGAWSGSGVVCLRSDSGVAAEDGLYNLRGRVISDEVASGFTGNVIPCAEAAGRVLTVQSNDGETYQLGYAWRDSSGWDMTPWANISRGDTVELVVRQSLEDTESAGFALFQANGSLVYVLEASRGAQALTSGDIPGLSYRIGEDVGSYATEGCGDRLSLTVEFETDAGMTTMYEGEDFGMQVGDEYMTTCSIASYEYTEACDEPAAEVSWVMFR